MKPAIRGVVAALTFLMPAAGGAQENASRASVSGSVSFEVATNVFGTTVKGKSRSLSGATRLVDRQGELRLEQIEAAVPVSTLRTGIRLRDEHMRDYIFATPDQQTPDVTFAAPAAECANGADRRNQGSYTCTSAGTLTIRGTARPFRIALAVARDGDSFRVKGQGKVTLSAYGIERPSQFGVRTADEVTIELDFSARTTTPTAQVR